MPYLENNFVLILRILLEYLNIVFSNLRFSVLGFIEYTRFQKQNRDYFHLLFIWNNKFETSCVMISRTYLL